MASARTAERAGAAAGFATLFGLAVLVLGPSPCVPRDASHEIDTARERLERAKAVRYGHPSDEQDERFDVLIGALAAGLGSAAPEALRESVEGIRAARLAEREASRAVVRRGEKARVPVEPAVDAAIARSSRVLAYLADDSGPDAGGSVWARMLVLAVAAAASIAAASSYLANRWRRAERDAIAALVCASAGAAHDGRLRVEVGRHIAVVAGRAVARERRAPEHTLRDERHAPPIDDGDQDGARVSSFGIGRIIDIHPDEPDAWDDG